MGGGSVAAGFDRDNLKHKMKEYISFVSEQANSLFFIGQLVHYIFASFHFLELVVTVCGEDCVAN